MEMDPNVSFEDEILSINPQYDLIFSKQDEQRLNQATEPWMSQPPRKCSSSKMKIISKINEIIGKKAVGELPTNNDWEDTESTEKETIALMRKLGLEPSIDRPPDERRTISTVPTNDDVIIMRNGPKKMSIFMANSYFELKPRSEPSFCMEEEDDDNSIETSTTSGFSDDVNRYEPIPLDSSNGTEITTISEDDNIEKDDHRNETAPYRKFSSDSWKRQSAENNVEQNRRCNWRIADWERSSERPSYSRHTNRSGAGTSSSSWRRSSDSSTDQRDEKNWRVSVNNQEDTEKNKEETVKPEPKAIINCGSPLLKPKELFMKRKAMLIQQVLAANQP